MAEPEEIPSIIGNQRREVDAIVDSVNELSFYLPGYSREEAFSLTHRERVKFTKLIEKAIERNAKGGYPYP